MKVPTPVVLGALGSTIIISILVFSWIFPEQHLIVKLWYGGANGFSLILIVTCLYELVRTGKLRKTIKEVSVTDEDP